MTVHLTTVIYGFSLDGWFTGEKYVRPFNSYWRLYDHKSSLNDGFPTVLEDNFFADTVSHCISALSTSHCHS